MNRTITMSVEGGTPLLRNLATPNGEKLAIQTLVAGTDGAKLARAANRGLVVGFNYSEEERLVEVHAIGVSGKSGELVMRGFQLGEGGGWRLFTISKIVGLYLTFEDSLAPRQGYKRGDTQMSPVIVELLDG